jgi:Uma2 family endonuclease
MEGAGRVKHIVGVLAGVAQESAGDSGNVHSERITARHAACVIRVTNDWLRPRSPMVVSVQNPVRLTRFTEPNPDIAVLRGKLDFYRSALPGPESVLLLIEVADVALAYDRRVKLPLYATAGIEDAWLIDLRNQTIEVHREPHDGRYQRVTVFRRGETLVPLALPDAPVAVDAILP